MNYDEWECITTFMKNVIKGLKEISGDIKKNGLDIKEIKENINKINELESELVNKELKKSAELDEFDEKIENAFMKK